MRDMLSSAALHESHSGTADGMEGRIPQGLSHRPD